MAEDVERLHPGWLCQGIARPEPVLAVLAAGFLTQAHFFSEL